MYHCPLLLLLVQQSVLEYCGTVLDQEKQFPKHWKLGKIKNLAGNLFASTLSEILKKLTNVTVDVYTFSSDCSYSPNFTGTSVNQVIDFINQIEYDGGSDMSCINVLKV